MEESGVFEYWFAFLFALGFCVWFPTYVVKTKGQGISLGVNRKAECRIFF